MNKISYEYFGEGQQLYFNINRIMQLEALLKEPIGAIVRNQDLGITTLTAMLSVGLSHYGMKNQRWYADRIQQLLDDGTEMEELQMPVVKALAACGILGRAARIALFPEEATEEERKSLERNEKNA